MLDISKGIQRHMSQRNIVVPIDNIFFYFSQFYYFVFFFFYLLKIHLYFDLEKNERSRA